MNAFRNIFLGTATVAFFFLLSSMSHAVDTTETFGTGVLTDFEAYSSFNYNGEGNGHGLGLLMGGGATETFSYALTVELASQDSSTEIGSFGFGFIWTAFENEAAALDFLPAFFFVADSGNEGMTYPGFDAFSCALELEFNAMALPVFQPFLLAGFAWSRDAEGGNSWQTPLALGSMIPLKKSVEFFIQLNWTPEENAAWGGSQKGMSLGLNIMATDNLEIITEAGGDFGSKEFVAGLGVIYSI